MGTARGVQREPIGRRGLERNLKQLERRFARFRRDHPPRTRIPDALRRDALAVLRLGATPSQLRRLCGVTPDQLRYWLGKQDTALAPFTPIVSEAQIFSVVGDLSTEVPEAGHCDGGRDLEIRLGEWSISVRHAIP